MPLSPVPLQLRVPTLVKKIRVERGTGIHENIEESSLLIHWRFLHRHVPV